MGGIDSLASARSPLRGACGVLSPATICTASRCRWWTRVEQSSHRRSCSTDLPENSEFTGNFLFFGTLPYSETFGNPSVTRSPRLYFIRCDETEQGITGKSREFATYCLQIIVCAIPEHTQRFPETS